MLLAGVDRFELSRARVKVLCLTAWRYPNVFIYLFYKRSIREFIFSGASRGIRTPDPRLRRAMLYPAELLMRVGNMPLLIVLFTQNFIYGQLPTSKKRQTIFSLSSFSFE